MARPLRLESPGALWHVTSRGNERHAIVRDDRDRQRFLAILAEAIADTGWRLFAYVLLDNHYHLLLETPEPNLSVGMRQLNGRYGQWFNRRHDRVGHVFQGRFGGIRIEREAHLLEVSRYVVLNPVRAGVTATAAGYRWSSFRATAGLRPAPAWLRTDLVLALFGVSAEAARRRYAAFVADGARRASPWQGLLQQVFLGSEAFVRATLGQVAADREVPKAQRDGPRPTLDQLLAAVARESGQPPQTVCRRRAGPERLLLAYLGRHDCALRLRALGDALDVDIGYVSRLAAQGQARLTNDPAFAHAVARVRRRLAARPAPVEGSPPPPKVKSLDLTP
jgi:REP element-mobilizing transposase RayT